MKSRKGLIAEADKWFSRYIRIRDTDAYGVGRCIDCGKPVTAVYADCGHFYSRRHLAVRWDEDNAHIQAKGCNYRMGEPEKNDGYRKRLIAKIGQERFDRLTIKKNNIAKFGNYELELIAAVYKEKTNFLLEKKMIEKWW